MYENQQPVLYLFTYPFDVNTTLVKGIFEHLHEEVILDWTYDYLDTFGINFVGNLVKIVSGLTIVRNLEFSLQTKQNGPIKKSKILHFRKS
jgi:hypothetical protein